MKRVKAILKGWYSREVIIYSLVYCLILNTSLPAVLATPSGGSFNVGTGSITQEGLATNVVVNQAQSVINWTSLNTLGGSPGVRESMNFSQGSLSNSAVLNRVSGATTQFNGDLNAPGMRIFIVNPAGVVFGEGSTVNVSQLVASGIGMTNTNFLNATANTGHKMVFSSGSGDVTNNGIITATDSVYLVGEDVANNGTILCPGGLVVMGACDATLRLGQPGSSVIVDISAGDLNADSGNDLSNNGTIGEAGSPVGKLALAAGDTFSQAITNVGDLAVIAYEDVTFNGDIDVTGNVDVRGGQNPRTDAAINVHGDITAASIRLKDGTDTGSGSVGEKSYSHIIVDEGKNLTATAGDVVMEAVHDIFLGGNVQASGNMYLNADEDGYGDPREPGYSAYPYGGGDVIAQGTLTAGGDIDISANAIRFEANVTATDGDLTITGRTSRDSAGNTQINRGVWGIIQAAEGTTLTAGGNVSIIDGRGGHEDPTPPGTLTMTGEGSLTIVSGAADGVDDGRIILQNVSLGVAGAASLKLEQDIDLDLTDEQWDLFNQSETDLTLVSNNGSITAVETGGNPDNAADQWSSVGAMADTGITLSGDQGNITTRQLISATGDIDVDVIAGQLLANEAIEATAGSVILTAADSIDADGDITAGTDIRLNNSIETAGDLLAGNDIIINEDITLNGGDWVSTDGQWSWQGSDQSITALAGTITAESWIWKETPGKLHMYGGDPELAIDIRYPGDLDEEHTAVATAGDLYILGKGDVQISGDLTALGGVYWGSPDWPEIEDGENVIEPVAVGGVSIVSENGKIYTEDGINNDTINVVIEGYSDQTVGSIGVDLPYDDGKAAIVLASNGDLNLSENAGLLAAGLYDAAVTDDRAAVGFLDKPEQIDGLMRNEGDPIDVAIYLASETGNVNIDSPVSIESEGEGTGTMVIDAYDTVTFGSQFEESLEGIGWLEVCSRRTGSLNEAVVNGTLPYADRSGPETGYVLRGESDLDINRAWVLDAMLPIATPDFAQTPKDVPVVELDILNNDDAGEFPPVTVTLDSPTSEHGGTLTLNPDSTVTYEPPTDLSGLSFDENGKATDTFTYSITDAGKVTSEITTVTITLTNTLPAAVVDTVVTDHGTPVVIPVLLNDSDPDADPMSVSSFGYEGTGTLVLNEDGTFTYTPAVSFAGVDSFVYSATDGFNNSTETTVTITVRPQSAPQPVAVVPYIQPAPGLQREVIETSGCPALVNWVASEFGTDKRMIQIWVANSLACGQDIQPCDAYANLKKAATILRDVNGIRVAALAKIISQFASSTAPPTEEQMASIAYAIANNVEGNMQYAAAGEYLDALVKYVGILTNEMGFSADESIQFVADHYIQKLADGENMGVAAFAAGQLTVLGGS